MEQWRDIAGYEGLYQVSDLGRIKSCERRAAVRPCERYPKGHTKRVAERIVKPWVTRGYEHVNLHDGNGNVRQLQVHRLVCCAFVPAVVGKDYVNHINGDRRDNRAANLEWVTPKENAQHAAAVLGHIARKLTDEQVREIRADNRSSRKIAADYGVSHSTVNSIKNGKYLSHVR